MRDKLIKIITSSLAIFMTMSSIGFAYYEDGYSVGNPDTSDWYEWQQPNDKEAFGTAIDASIFLDAPAGKHGYLKSEGDKFVFDDGTEIRFWATNVCNRALFSEHEDAEKIADRIKRAGYNLVRFHHLDLNNNNNIFGVEVSKKMEIDQGQLDKIFYFFSCLKERGIYVMIDLQNRLAFFPESEDTYAKEPVSNPYWMDYYWNENSKAIVKKYLKELYTTKNPYTGMTLGEDPALVLMDLTNESGLLNDFNYKPTTSIGKAQRDKPYNEWLLKKYGSTEELKKAWTQEGRNRKLGDEEKLELGTVKFQGDMAYLKLMESGASDQELSDVRAFLYDFQIAYYKEMIEFVRNELGYKGNIAGVGGGGDTYGALRNLNGLMSEIHGDMFDYFDAHSYKSHPSDYNWNPGGAITSWTSNTTANTTELFKNTVNFDIYNMPRVVSEWNVCSPGPYAAEGQIFMAVQSVLHEWHPVHFCLIEGHLLPEGEEQTETFFDIFYQADQTAILPAAAMLYLRGDIKPFEDKYYMPYTHEELMSHEFSGRNLQGFDHLTAYYDAGIAPVDSERCADYEPETEVIERAVEKYRNNAPQNEQVNWNDDLGIFRLQTEYANVAMGYIGSKEIDLDYAIIEMENYSGVATLTSTTKETLEDTDSILVTLVTKSRNKGLVLDKNRGMKLENTGSAPQIMEPVVAGITIKSTEDIKVYKLSHSGKREEEIPVEKLSNGYSYFKADGKTYKTPYFEIVK